MKGPTISENGTPSLPADAPCEKETYQHQRGKSGEAPKRDILSNFHAAVLRKSGEVGDNSAQGRSQRHCHAQESGD